MSFLDEDCSTVSTGANVTTSTDVAWTPNTNSGAGYNGTLLASAAGRAYYNGSGQALYAAKSNLPTAADYTVQCDCYFASLVSSISGVGGRGADAGSGFNGYAIVYREFYGWRLVRFDFGATTFLGTINAADPSPGQTVTAVLTFNGSSITGSLFGDQTGSLTVTDSTYSAKGYVFIYDNASSSSTTGMHFDNMLAFDPVVPVRNLIAYWKMNESSGNAADAHTVGPYNLTDNGGVGTASGKLNGARSFDAVDDYLSYASNLLNGLSSYSFSCWAYSTEITAAFRANTILATYDNAVGAGTFLGFDGGSGAAKFRFRKRVSYGNGDALANSGFVVSTWYHVVGTVSASGTLTLYIDGVAQTTTGSKSGSLSNTSATIIGADDTLLNNWKGYLDEVGIWSRDLNLGEVLTLYGNGTPAAYPSPPTPALAVTVASVGQTTGGTVALGTIDTGTTTNVTFVLTDAGGANLTLGTITKTGSRVTITTDPSGLVINPTGGGTTSRNLIVSIDTSTTGSITGSVTIPSDDAATPFVLNITGTVANPSPPSAPTGLSASATSDTTVDLAWTDNSSNETGFIVEWSANGSTGWTSLTTTAANAVTYTDSTIAASTTRYYRVRATNAAGDSSNTSTASATTPAAGAPLAPSGLRVTALSDTRGLITWDNATTGSAATSIVISRQDGGSGSYNDVVTLGAGNNLWMDRSLWPATAYSYKVSAVNGAGRTTSATPVGATTLANQGTMATPSSLAGTVSDAWTIALTWTSNYSSSQDWILERSNNGGVTYRVIATSTGGSGTSSLNAYTDRYLVPSTAYKYRVKIVAYGVKSAYVGSSTITTSARPSGGPLEPTGFDAVETGPTTVACTWTDTNSGAVAYEVERSDVTAFMTAPSFALIGTTSNGATSYTDATASPRGAYWYRVRAKDGSNRRSGYAVRSGYPATPVTVFTPWTASQGGRDFHIGSGKTYTSIGDFSTGFGWDNLAADDTVYIHSGTYHERLMLSCRGLPSHPIRIVGVPDPSTGARPIIDGTSATTAAEFVVGYTPYETYGLIFVGPHVTSGPYHPGHLVIQGLQLQNTTGSFTGYAGATQTWAPGSGFYMTWCDDVTIRDCKLSVDSNGVFFKSYGDPIRFVADVTIDRNWFIGNGKPNSYLEHSSYGEGYRTTYQYNRYDPLRAQAGGNSGIKDRGVGTVIRYNYLSGSAHYHDLVESQDLYPGLILDPDEGGCYVYGNTYYSTSGTGNTASDFIHYGGDQGNTWIERFGVLRFYGNTLVQDTNTWKITIFNATGGMSAIDSRNNIIYIVSPTEVDLHTPVGNGWWGTNWISSTWALSFSGAAAYSGAAAGVGGALTTGTPRGITNNGGTNTPGFTNASTQDFRLASGGDALSKAAALPSDWPAITASYYDVARGIARSSTADLGAYSPAVTGDSTAPTLGSLAISTSGQTLTGTFSEACAPLGGQGGFTVSGAEVRDWTIAGTAFSATLTDVVYSGATKTLSYATTGAVKDPAGNALATITNAAITNNSTQVADVTAPTTPTGLSATAGVRSVALAWTASTDAVGVVAYFIYRGGVKVLTVASPSVSITNTGLTAGTSYSFTVSAVDRAGNESSQTGSQSATPLPSTPASSPTPSAGSPTASVTLSWSAVSLAVNYKVYRDAVLIATVAAPTTTYDDSGASLGPHDYTVVASGLDGDASASSAVTVTSSRPYSPPRRPLRSR